MVDEELDGIFAQGVIEGDADRRDPVACLCVRVRGVAGEDQDPHNNQDIKRNTHLHGYHPLWTVWSEHADAPLGHSIHCLETRGEKSDLITNFLVGLPNIWTDTAVGLLLSPTEALVRWVLIDGSREVLE